MSSLLATPLCLSLLSRFPFLSLYPPPQSNRFVDIMILARLERDRHRPIDHRKRSRHLSGSRDV